MRDGRLIMDEITQHTVWEVDGQQFDTEDAARAHVRNAARVAAVADFLFGHTDLLSDESNATAASIVEHWDTLRAIMEQPK